MALTLTGRLQDPFGNALEDAGVRFRSARTSTQVLANYVAETTTDSNGDYTITVQYGVFHIEARQSNSEPWYTIARSIPITVDTTSTDINSLIVAYLGAGDATPDIVLEIEAITATATTAASSAATSAQQASDAVSVVTTDASSLPAAVNGATLRALSQRFADNVNCKDFGAVGDGATDDSTAFSSLSSYLLSRSSVVDSRNSAIPRAYLPAGRYVINSANALASAFSSGHTRGLAFVGDGEEHTEIYIDIPSGDFAADLSFCSYVMFEGITFNLSDSTQRGIYWASTGDGTGSNLVFRDCRVIGDYESFLTIGGTVLGSETYFERVSGPVPTGGAFFNVESTNPQAVNHTFLNCTIGGNGTVFKLRAGGNIRWFGGYVSMFEGHKFLDIDASGSQIGSNNKNILVSGCNFETNSSPVGPRVLVENNSPAFVKFSDCNFNAIATTITGTNPVVIMGDAAYQRGGDLIFDTCISPDRMTTASGGVNIRYLNCDNMRDWQEFITAERSTASNLLQPTIEIDGCQSSGATPRMPVDCYPSGIINDYEGGPVPSIQKIGSKRKRWVSRNGATNTSNGLLAGLGDEYASFSVSVPLGAIVTSITLFYLQNDASTTSTRTFKVEGGDGSELMPETAISFPATSATRVDSPSLLYIADSEANREIVMYGKVASGSSGGLIGDYGFFEIEYI